MSCPGVFSDMRGQPWGISTCACNYFTSSFLAYKTPPCSINKWYSLSTMTCCLVVFQSAEPRFRLGPIVVQASQLSRQGLWMLSQKNLGSMKDPKSLRMFWAQIRIHTIWLQIYNRAKVTKISWYCQKDKCMDQQNRLESSQIHKHT